MEPIIHKEQVEESKRIVLSKRTVRLSGNSDIFHSPMLIRAGKEEILGIPNLSAHQDEPQAIFYVNNKAFIPSTPGIAVGRNPDNDISLADSSVSRQHFRADVTEEGITISDLQSTNNTMVTELGELKEAQVYDLTGGKALIGLLSDKPLVINLGDKVVNVRIDEKGKLHFDGVNLKITTSDADPTVHTYTIGSSDDDKNMLKVINRSGVIEVEDLNTQNSTTLQVKRDTLPTPEQETIEPITQGKTEDEGLMTAEQLEKWGEYLGKHIRQNGAGYLMAALPDKPDPSILQQQETTGGIGGNRGHDSGAAGFSQGKRLLGREIMDLQRFLNVHHNFGSNHRYENFNILTIDRHTPQISRRIVGYREKSGFFGGKKQEPQYGEVAETFRELAGGEGWGVYTLYGSTYYPVRDKEMGFRAQFMAPPDIADYFDTCVKMDPRIPHEVIKNIWKGLIGDNPTSQINLYKGKNLTIYDYTKDPNSPEKTVSIMPKK